MVVTAPNNQVTIAFFGITGPPVQRRVYRGTTSGLYEGYFDAPWPFVDSGQAFTGIKSPMYPGFDAETSMQEPDANYAVLVTPAWNTTTWVTDKATTGFTVHFGTAPGSDSVLDWFMVR